MAQAAYAFEGTGEGERQGEGRGESGTKDAPRLSVSLFADDAGLRQSIGEDVTAAGFRLGAELRAVGIDFSFAPVVDLDDHRCAAIGDRSFGTDPRAVIDLAGAVLSGLDAAGVAACLKHFPGHGGVTGDTHVEFPVDSRSLAQLLERDLAPFVALASRAAAVMPAHVEFPAVAPGPVGFSSRWLKAVLRDQCGFAGIVFSDDLAMAAATVAGMPLQRVRAALAAGCDAALFCNRPQELGLLLDELRDQPAPPSDFSALRPTGSAPMELAAVGQDSLEAELIALERLDS